MPRAAIQFRRQPDDTWKAMGVWFATPGMLMSRFLPDSGMGDFVRRIHATARVSPVDGQSTTWEDWVGYALDALSNGHDLMMGEVAPEASVDRQYAKDVLGLKGKALDRYTMTGIPNVTAGPVPDGLGPGGRA